MSDLANWQGRYFMFATDSITATGTTNGTYGENKGVVYLKNNPAFEPNLELVNNQKSTGYPFPVRSGTTNIERAIGTKAPSVTYEFDFDAGAAYIPLLTLFQTANAVTGDTFNKVFAPYSIAQVSKYAVLYRQMEDGVNQVIPGAIARSITISGEEGGSVSMSVEWAGSDFLTDNNATPDFTITDSEGLDFVMFHDLDFAYNTTGTTIDVVGFEITITNNVFGRHYDNQAIQKWLLGRLEITGTLRFPWGESNIGANTIFQKHLNQEDFIIHIWKGHYLKDDSGSQGDMTIVLNLQPENITTNTEDEITNELSFSAIYDGTNQPIEIYLYDGINREDY